MTSGKNSAHGELHQQHKVAQWTALCPSVYLLSMACECRSRDPRVAPCHHPCRIVASLANFVVLIKSQQAAVHVHNGPKFNTLSCSRLCPAGQMNVRPSVNIRIDCHVMSLASWFSASYTHDCDTDRQIKWAVNESNKHNSWSSGCPYCGHHPVMTRQVHHNYHILFSIVSGMFKV